MTTFDTILDQARALDAGAVSAVRPRVALPPTAVTDDRWLAEMTRSVFRAGFVWRVVDERWPAFERAFNRFDPAINAAVSDDWINRTALDTSIIRHAAKVASVRSNADFVRAVAVEAGSFNAFVTLWPEDDPAGLLLWLRQRGSRLGGHTGQHLLRAMGRDTFVLSRDTLRCLVQAGIVDTNPGTISALRGIATVFIRWRDETGRTFTELSDICALAGAARQSAEPGSSSTGVQD